MMILMTAALAAAQPSPAPSATAPMQSQNQQMEHMAAMGHMSEKQMAECHKCCEKMMARMHHRHTQHRAG
jgi:hypothetical protein